MIEKNLQLIGPLDENLKAIQDEDGTSVPMQLSKDKLKIVGDLDVTGNIDSSTVHAGQIIGYTCLLNDAADTSYAVTTSFVTVNADCKITFVAPPSGNVEIFTSVFCKWTSTRTLEFGLSDNATYNTLDVTHEHLIGEEDEEGQKQINHRWIITGLTSVTSYTYYLGAKAEQASRITLYWGGDATGEYAPFIMKATALPIGIYQG